LILNKSAETLDCVQNFVREKSRKVKATNSVSNSSREISLLNM